MIGESELIEFLDEFLSVDDITDDTANGIQVDAPGEPKKVAFAVDARRDVIERAVDYDMLVVHHGMFWGDIDRVAGRAYHLLSTLIKNDVALYVAHLPLDIHPKIGNNVLLADAVGAYPEDTFMEYRGTEVSLLAMFEPPTRADEIAARLKEVTGETPFVYLPDNMVKTAAIMTGKGGMALPAAAELGADLFITGERTYMAYNQAVDMEMPIIFGGHHATETLGIKELMNVVEHDFDCMTEFISAPSPI